MRLLQTDGSIIIGDYRYFTHAALNVPLPATLLSTWDWEAPTFTGSRWPIPRTSIRSKASHSRKFSIATTSYSTMTAPVRLLTLSRSGKHPITSRSISITANTAAAVNDLARVDDAYVVAGQASRSAKWLHKGPALFQRLLERYSAGEGSGTQRLLKGTPAQIDILRLKARDVEMRMGFFIVQPAFSAARVTDSVMTVLGTSYMYLRDIANVDLRVIASP